VLAILGRCILIEQLTARIQSRYVYISGRQICDLGTLSSMIFTTWHRWRLFWCWLFALDLRRCTRFFCASSVSVDTLLWHFCKERRCQLDFHKPLLGVVLLQLSPVYAQEIQNPASSLLGLLCEASWSGVVFRLWRHAKNLLWPFWPYSRQGIFLSVLAGPDLLALP